jgi:DNA-binding NarL/FixJ family response regulator
MELQPGDIVRTESGEVGKVVHTSRMTVFVALPTSSGDDTVAAYLESQLTKLEEQSKRDEEPRVQVSAASTAGLDEACLRKISELSSREREVFELMGDGLAASEIGAKLNIATTTVETYRERLKDKLGIHHGTSLVRCAILWRLQCGKPHGL